MVLFPTMSALASQPAATASELPPDCPYDHFAIFPPIGIARVGNSDEYFIGPEIPGRPSGGADFKFKDATGKVKKQAVRFRIYGYKDNKVVGEITAREGVQITWHVQLANKKAGWHNFVGRFKLKEDGGWKNVPLRNSTVTNRSSLEVTPDGQFIGGLSAKKKANFDGRVFTDGTRGSGCEVHLGTAEVELETGRLIVTGGHGHSASSKPDIPITHYSNNDWWYDDTADGPVTATVLIDGLALPNLEGPSWVIVTPPKFAPSTHNICSLYDRIKMTQGLIPEEDDEVKFYRDINPLFENIKPLSFLNSKAKEGHNSGPTDTFTNDSLSDPSGDAAFVRDHVFQRVRDPKSKQPEKQASGGYMPRLSGDDGDATDGKPRTWLAVFPQLYSKLAKWAKGEFTKDEKLPAPADTFESIDPTEQPAALTKAALEWCVGGPFYPGIEMTYICRKASTFDEKYPFRMRAENFGPGDVTKYMACPWQADFYECNTHWWPAQRPDDVLTEENLKKLAAGTEPGWTPEPWARPNFTPNPDNNDDDPVPHPGDMDMAERWWQLGFVVPQQYADPNYVPPKEDPKHPPPMIDVLVETETYQGLMTWYKDIRFLFTSNDIRYGKQMGYEFSSYADVSAKSSEILKGLQDKTLPPDSKPWSEEKINKFAKWIEGGLVDGTPVDSVSEREAFYKILNIEFYPEFLPTAKAMAEKYLKDAEDLMDLDTAAELKIFEYSSESFKTRMDYIYDLLVARANEYDPAKDGTFNNREQCIERIRQNSPFNLLDGAWIRNIVTTGPIDRVRANLYGVLQDEIGDGQVVLNHCTLYLALMKSVGIYPEDIHTRDFAYDDKLLDSAFSAPVYELSVGLFPDAYYPELLGTTLQIEWNVLDLKTTAMLFEHYNLDPHYYTLHIGIDNAASGHGHLAFQAVELYLEQVRKNGGDVQEAFRRIWRGYVAFGTVGTLGIDLSNMFKDQYPADGNLASYYRCEMLKLIKKKAEYGSKNHDNHKLGDGFINSFFSDPEAFLDALHTQPMENGKHAIVPGDLDASYIFQLVSFNGPMNHVFTLDELALWKNYILSLKPKVDKKKQLERLKESTAVPIRTREQFRNLCKVNGRAPYLGNGTANGDVHADTLPAPSSPTPSRGTETLLWLSSSRAERERSLSGLILGRGSIH